MKYLEFKKAVKKPFFGKIDREFMGRSLYSSQLSLWAKKGYIIMLKRGLYVFADEKERLAPEEVSFFLYEPSYLSLEYALGRYGFIPEMVFAKTCVTTRTPRKFSNIFGAFSYRHIQPRLFFGYSPIETSFGKYLLAEPEKALLDYLYFKSGTIHTKTDLSELRLNIGEIQKTLDREKLKTYLREFGIRKLDHLIHMILSS